MNLQIHQILPTISYGDAIGNEVLEIKSILKAWGYKSEIFAQHIHPGLNHVVRPYTEYKRYSSPENVLIFHFSIGSDVSGFVKNLQDRKVIVYHNITPHNYFVGINDRLVHLLSEGRNELAEYSNITDLALGDSEYSQKELVELGFKNTGVLPLIIDFGKYVQRPNQKVLDMFAAAHSNFIFVGRLIPNKKQEDIIKIFYYYNKCIDHHSRLFLVGSYEGTEKYYAQLRGLVKQMNLQNVYFTGHVNFKELLAYYRLADIFICMSEHEGFCLPLLESMYFEIPIIAYNSTAVPYTLNGSGVIAIEKQYEELAELAHILIKDEKIRNRIIEKQKLRLKDFERSKVEAIFKKHIEEVIS